MARPVSSESAFRAIAHQTRRRILELLALRTMSAGEIAAEFSSRQPTISRHIRVLHSSGLISMKQQGLSISYSLNSRGLDPVRRWTARMPRRAG
jgi:DNA-binding transcriptional ArsR family regulator